MFKRLFILVSLHLASLPASTQKQHYVIGNLQGHLGSMLFEVATTCAVAWDHAALPYFPGFAPLARELGGEYQHLFFRCTIEPPSQEISFEWNTPTLGYVPIPYRPQMSISGYSQNEKYFARHRDRLLYLFSPSNSDLHYLEHKYNWLISHPHTVSIHIDFHDEEALIEFDADYFEKAMNLFPDDSVFVITSDNLNFVKESLPAAGKNLVFIQNEPFYIDFFLRSMCKHNIISNSALSWWGAWLNQNPRKAVIRPKQWLHNQPDIGGPDEWIKIESHEKKEYVQRSVTGSQLSYIAACNRAVDDPRYFELFRSHPEYAPVLECKFAKESGEYLLTKSSSQILDRLDLFRRIDHYGHPEIHNVPHLGRFSGTTLRYIVIADQIQKHFALPPNPKIVEIGAGFGGQCYVLSHTTSFSEYFIYDLPDAQRLIRKMLNTLRVDNVHLVPYNEPLKEKKIDLLISNYAFSECDRKTQLDYFTRVIKKADRGFVIFNKVSNLDCLSSDEFVQLLIANRMNPKIYPEPVFTYKDNLLIVWDNTK